MLARAPGEVATRMSHKYNVPRRQRGSPRPAWGNGAVCPATPGANAHGVPRTAVTSANGAPSRPAGRGPALSLRSAPALHTYHRSAKDTSFGLGVPGGADKPASR